MEDKNGDIHRRVGRLEEQHDKSIETIQQLVVTTKILAENVSQMTEVVKELKDLEPRMRGMETDINNNKLVVKGLLWTASTVGGTGVLVALTYLFNMPT